MSFITECVKIIRGLLLAFNPRSLLLPPLRLRLHLKMEDKAGEDPLKGLKREKVLIENKEGEVNEKPNPLPGSISR
jgi:hypothetical protein